MKNRNLFIPVDESSIMSLENKKLPVFVIGLTPQGLSVLRTLSRKGVRVIAFYMNKKNVGVHSKYGEKIFCKDAYDLKNKIHFWLYTIGIKPLCYITSGELLALILREYKELYDECDVISGPFDVVERLAHKDKMYELAIENGFKVGPYKTLDTYNEGDLQYPLFIKRNYEIPLFFKAEKIENREQLQFFLMRIEERQKKDIIVQEFINIPRSRLLEISAQCFFCKGEIKGILVAEQRRKLKKGLTSFLVEIDDKALKENVSNLCSEFMKGIGYTGFAEFEFIMDDKTNELYFMEVNTRTCGEQSAMSYKFSNLAEVMLNPYKALSLQSVSHQIRWMNICRDIRVRIQKHDFKNLFDFYTCKYDILDFKDLTPFFRQII